MISKIRIPNILDFYNKIGFDILDQTQPENIARANGDKMKAIVFQSIWKKLVEQNKITQKYGVTLTFSPKWHNEDPLELHRIVIDKMNRSTVCKDIEYIIFPEFSKKGQLHYHGIVFNCYQLPFIRFSKWWKRTFGFAKVELEIRYYLCQDKIGVCIQKRASRCWCHYITKDNGKTGLWSLVRFNCQIKDESKA